MSRETEAQVPWGASGVEGKAVSPGGKSGKG